MKDQEQRRTTMALGTAAVTDDEEASNDGFYEHHRDDDCVDEVTIVDSFFLPCGILDDEDVVSDCPGAEVGVGSSSSVSATASASATLTTPVAGLFGPTSLLQQHITSSSSPSTSSALGRPSSFASDPGPLPQPPLASTTVKVTGQTNGRPPPGFTSSAAPVDGGVVGGAVPSSNATDATDASDTVSSSPIAGKPLIYSTFGTGSVPAVVYGGCPILPSLELSRPQLMAIGSERSQQQQQPHHQQNQHSLHSPPGMAGDFGGNVVMGGVDLGLGLFDCTKAGGGVIASSSKLRSAAVGTSCPSTSGSHSRHLFDWQQAQMETPTQSQTPLPASVFPPGDYRASTMSDNAVLGGGSLTARQGKQYWELSQMQQEQQQPAFVLKKSTMPSPPPGFSVSPLVDDQPTAQVQSRSMVAVDDDGNIVTPVQTFVGSGDGSFSSSGLTRSPPTTTRLANATHAKIVKTDINDMLHLQGSGRDSNMNSNRRGGNRSIDSAQKPFPSSALPSSPIAVALTPSRSKDPKPSSRIVSLANSVDSALDGAVGDGGVVVTSNSVAAGAVRSITPVPPIFGQQETLLSPSSAASVAHVSATNPGRARASSADHHVEVTCCSSSVNSSSTASASHKRKSRKKKRGGQGGRNKSQNSHNHHAAPSTSSSAGNVKYLGKSGVQYGQHQFRPPSRFHQHQQQLQARTQQQSAGQRSPEKAPNTELELPPHPQRSDSSVSGHSKAGRAKKQLHLLHTTVQTDQGQPKPRKLQSKRSEPQKPPQAPPTSKRVGQKPVATMTVPSVGGGDGEEGGDCRADVHKVAAVLDVERPVEENDVLRERREGLMKSAIVSAPLDTALVQKNCAGGDGNAGHAKVPLTATRHDNSAVVGGFGVGSSTARKTHTKSRVIGSSGVGGGRKQGKGRGVGGTSKHCTPNSFGTGGGSCIDNFSSRASPLTNSSHVCFLPAWCLQRNYSKYRLWAARTGRKIFLVTTAVLSRACSVVYRAFRAIAYVTLLAHKLALREVIHNQVGLFCYTFSSSYPSLMSVACERWSFPHWLPQFAWMCVVVTFCSFPSRCTSSTIADDCENGVLMGRGNNGKKDDGEPVSTVANSTRDERREREAVALLRRIAKGGKDGARARKEAARLSLDTKELIAVANKREASGAGNGVGGDNQQQHQVHGRISRQQGSGCGNNGNRIGSRRSDSTEDKSSMGTMAGRRASFAEENEMTVDGSLKAMLWHTWSICRIILFVSFSAECLTNPHRGFIMGLSGSEQVLVGFMIAIVKMGYIFSPVAWISWSVQVLVMSLFHSNFVLEHVLLVMGLATLNLVSCVKFTGGLVLDREQHDTDGKPRGFNLKTKN